MKVLVATNETQRTVKGDYSFTAEGELVYLESTSCRNPLCGCDRGFVGMASRRATTTAKVADRPGLTPVLLRQVLVDSLKAGGWLDAMAAAGVAETGVDDLLKLLDSVVGSAPAETIVRRTGDVMWLRHPSTSHTPKVY